MARNRRILVRRTRLTKGDDIYTVTLTSSKKGKMPTFSKGGMSKEDAERLIRSLKSRFPGAPIDRD